MDKKKGERYKLIDTKEVDSYLQSELQKVSEKAKCDNIKVSQTVILDLLDPSFSKLQTETLDKKLEILQKDQVSLHNQLRRRASSISSTGSSPQSKVNSPQTLSIVSSPQSSYESKCLVCHKTSIFETVVTWKECKHTMVSIPHLSL